MVPEPARAMLLASEGEEGRAWLEALPRLVGVVSARWGVRLGPPFPGGNVAYVAPGELRDGRAVVVKVQLVTEETRYEGAALRHWGPEVAVEVLDEAPELGALLLERLEPGEPLGMRPLEEQLAVITDVLPRLWRRPGPTHQGLTKVAHSLERWLSTLQREAASRELDSAARHVREAADVLREPDLRPVGHPVVVNRDFHSGNVLSAQRVPWLVIDPKPLVGEPAFDCGHLVRELLRTCGLEHAARIVPRLSEGLELDSARVRAWGVLRAAINAAWARETGMGDPNWELRCVRELLALPV